LRYKKSASNLISRSKNSSNQIILPYASEISNKDIPIFRSTVKIPNAREDQSRIILTDKYTKKPVQLTLRQRQSQCLALLAKGYSIKEIAIKMLLSHRTVEHYVERVREILNCRNTKELIANFFLNRK
jgi:DNA-binding CsgD family transcriptional regulator